MCISCALAGFPEQIVGLVVFSAQISLSPHLQRAIDTDNIATPASSSSSCAVAWLSHGEIGVSRPRERITPVYGNPVVGATNAESKNSYARQNATSSNFDMKVCV